MQAIAQLALGATLLVAPALAQTAREADERASRPPSTGTTQQGPEAPSRSPGPPIDRGPNTPEANRAHSGGGVVLEGAPGAPAPAPQPTPPVTTPRDTAPAR